MPFFGLKTQLWFESSVRGRRCTDCELVFLVGQDDSQCALGAVCGTSCHWRTGLEVVPDCAYKELFAEGG